MPGATPAAAPPRRRIHLFPGIFGEEPTFCDLRDALRDGFDAVVVPYPAVTAPTRLLTDIDAAAAAIVERLMAEPSDAPALVIGYSYGGNLACAVAARLMARGRPVALLGLLDPALPTTQFDVRQRGPASAVADVPLRRPGLAYRSRLLRSALAMLCCFAPARTRQKLQRRTLWTLRAYARRAWRPRRIACPVLHIVTEQFAPAVTAGWAALCPDIRQVDIGDRHVDLLRGQTLSQVVDALQSALTLATPRDRHRLDDAIEPSTHARVRRPDVGFVKVEGGIAPHLP